MRLYNVRVEIMVDITKGELDEYIGLQINNFNYTNVQTCDGEI